MISALKNYREPLLFTAVTLVFLWPLVGESFFTTIDGPAHLYNARLLHHWWSGGESSSHLSAYLERNSWLPTNVLVHYTMAALLFLFPAVIVEKIILALLIAGLPIAGRRLLHRMGAPSPWMAYALFPLTYSYLFYFGFYNHLLSVIFMLILTSIWLRYRNERDRTSLISMSLLSMALVMTHLFGFALWLMALGTFQAFSYWSERMPSSSHVLREWIANVPALIMTLAFLFQGMSAQVSIDTLAWSDIFTSLRFLMPVKGIPDAPYNLVVQFYRVFLLLCALWMLRAFTRERTISNTSLRWLTLLGITIVLLFAVPDSVGANGTLTARFMNAALLFLIILLGTHRYPLWLRAVGVVLLVFTNAFVWWNNTVHARQISHWSTEIHALATLLPADAVVLPITASDHPLLTHASNYLGADQPFILLDNYEASLHYFPLHWSTEERILFTLGDRTADSCIRWHEPISPEWSQPAPYVLWIGPTDTGCFAPAWQTVTAHYRELSAPTEELRLLEWAPTP